MDTVRFSWEKRAILPKVKEIKRLRGGVVVYAAQANVRIDAEMGGRVRFRMKTNYNTWIAVDWQNFLLARTLEGSRELCYD
jgi:hypothetical protein